MVSPLGKVLGTESFPATAAGHRRLLVRARKQGTVRRADVEGTGTFGAGLSRYLLAQHVQVYESGPTAQPAVCSGSRTHSMRRLLRGPCSAVAPGQKPATVRCTARMFKLAKDSAVKARTQAINQLKAVLVIADPALRERLSRLGSRELFRTCARLSPLDGEDGGDDQDAVAQATHIPLSFLAQHIEQLTAEIDELNRRPTRLVERHAPQLLTPVGVGPDSAVTLLITMGDNPER